MRHPLLKICLLIILWLAGGTIIAQHNITINDSLAFHGERLEINVDYPVGTNQKFSMGDYTIIVDQQMRHTYSDTKKRLLGVREVTDIINIVSFSISDSSSNTAMVTIEEKKRDNSYDANKVIDLFFPQDDDEDYLVDEHQEEYIMIPIGKFESLAAPITIVGDTSASWTFFMVKAKGNQWTPPIKMFLTDETRRINLYHVSSDIYYDYSHPHRYRKNKPAMGVELIEEGKSLCAVQYDSGAANKPNLGPDQSFGCLAWMLCDLDPRTKLVLAATMSTIMLLNNQYLSILE